MSARPTESLGPAYFDRVYAGSTDPWGFATSAYEDAKYTATLAALPRARYRRCLEVGCAIGVLSGRLAPRVGELVGVDVNDAVLAEARRRNRAHPHLRFARMMYPRERPGGRFDLALVSEVGYYWGGHEFYVAQDALLESLESGGHLVLVHYTPHATDYPLTGDQVHERFLELCSHGLGVEGRPALRHLGGSREDRYRLDVFERLA